MTTSQDEVSFEETEAYRDCALCVVSQIVVAVTMKDKVAVELLENALATIELHARHRGIILRVR